jgi:adenylate cyclase
MSDIFVSYARSDEAAAGTVANALRELGYGVWRDDQLPAHRPYADVIEERLKAAKAVVVLWSADAVKSQWVRAEAEAARMRGSLVQLNLDGSTLPMPFGQIQCADFHAWQGDRRSGPWRQVADAVSQLVGAARAAVDSAPPGADREPVLAVVPFDNLSSDAEMAFFSDGVSQEILDTVMRRAGLKVIARASSFQLRGPQKSPRNAFAELGATHLLDGAVRSAGRRVRVSAQLVECPEGLAIWSERFDRELEDIFAVQDEIAGAVGEALNQALSKRAPALRVAPDVYEAFLKAQALQATTPVQPNDPVLPLLEAVVAEAPGLAAAWEALARRRASLFRNGFGSSRAAAEEATQTALRLDPNAVGAYSALASLEPWGDYAARERHHAAALAAAPNHPEALFAMGVLMGSVGRMTHGRSFVFRAAELDPLLPGPKYWRASAMMQMGRVEEAGEQLDEIVARWPHMAGVCLTLAAQWSDWDRVDRYKQAGDSAANPRVFAENVAFGEQLRHPDPAVAARAVDRARGIVERTGTVPINRLTALAAFGLKDEAFEIADQASFDHLFDPSGPPPGEGFATSILFMKTPHPDLIDDERFVGLCGRLGFVRYWNESGQFPDFADTAPYDARDAIRRASGRH